MYEVGDVAKVSFVNPFERSRILVIYGKQWADTTIRVFEGYFFLTYSSSTVPHEFLSI